MAMLEMAALCMPVADFHIDRGNHSYLWDLKSGLPLGLPDRGPGCQHGFPGCAGAVLGTGGFIQLHCQEGQLAAQALAEVLYHTLKPGKVGGAVPRVGVVAAVVPENCP